MTTGTNELLHEAIRSVGLRATPARVATLRLLREANSPVTHSEVAAGLSTFGIDKATVFRNLNDLTEAGLLRRTELGDHVYRFEAVLAGEDPAVPHPHFMCIVCGSISCMGDSALTLASLRKNVKVGEIQEILLRGRCRDCIASNKRG
ncbi:MAG: transcriptional repressor [Planctomycetota bacterium]